MDYKGFNIAVHEMGHNVEQIISLHEVDHTLLAGVPNTAFTEALAFVFQARDLELLGLAVARRTRPPRPTDPRRLLGRGRDRAVALVDMGVWHWMYDHPEATPAELREATMAIARDVWNAYCAPVFGDAGQPAPRRLLPHGHPNLYLPDYPIGHLIAVQLEEQMAKSGDLGAEFSRVSAIGRVVPDLWMEKATGSPVGPEALLRPPRSALEWVEAE